MDKNPRHPKKSDFHKTHIRPETKRQTELGRGVVKGKEKGKDPPSKKTTKA